MISPWELSAVASSQLFLFCSLLFIEALGDVVSRLYIGQGE